MRKELPTPDIDHTEAFVWGTKSDIKDPVNITRLLKTLSKNLNLKVVKSYSHQFTPHGLTTVLVLKESHLAVHTWPEFSFVHLDLVSCRRKIGIGELKASIKKLFGPTKIQINKI